MAGMGYYQDLLLKLTIVHKKIAGYGRRIGNAESSRTNVSFSNMFDGEQRHLLIILKDDKHCYKCGWFKIFPSLICKSSKKRKKKEDKTHRQK